MKLNKHKEIHIKTFHNQILRNEEKKKKNLDSIQTEMTQYT